MKAILLFAIIALGQITGYTENKFKAMTFNIRNGIAKDGENHWDKRMQMVFDRINQCNADVVGLQEAYKFQLDEILNSCDAYEFTGVGRNDGKEAGEYCAILFKKNKFDLVTTETKWLSTTPDRPSISWGHKNFRIVTWAKLKDKSTGFQFYIYNAHFDHKSLLAKEQSVVYINSLIKSRKETHPFIFMGDLNSTIESKQIKYLQQENESWNADITFIDTHFVVHPNDKNTGTVSRFEYGYKGSKIDYIYIEKGSAVVISSKIDRTSVNKRYPSDHFPVITELKF